MNISILHKISEFAKENNISIKGIYYKFPSNFPEAFKRTVNNYLERAYSKYNIKGKIDDFFIGFDKNKNAYLQFIGKIEDPNNVGDINKVKEVRVLVFEDWIKYDFSFDSASIIKENTFLENIKNLDNSLYLETHDELPINFTNRFFREYQKGKPIEKYFDELCDDIINYINYLNNEANLSYELLNKELEDAKEVEKIYFIESNATINSTRTTTYTPKIQTERKNEEIPFDERKRVLDSYSAEETFEARSSNTNSVYYVKVFKVKEKCKLIMEPVEGNKYTKVVYLDQEKLSSKEIKEIVIDYLQLNRNETTNTDEMTRHSHTTLDEYKKLLEYLISEKNRGISSTTKIRIDEANNLKR